MRQLYKKQEVEAKVEWFSDWYVKTGNSSAVVSFQETQAGVDEEKQLQEWK